MSITGLMRIGAAERTGFICAKCLSGPVLWNYADDVVSTESRRILKLARSLEKKPRTLLAFVAFALTDSNLRFAAAADSTAAVGPHTECRLRRWQFLPSLFHQPRDPQAACP